MHQNAWLLIRDAVCFGAPTPLRFHTILDSTSWLCLTKTIRTWFPPSNSAPCSLWSDTTGSCDFIKCKFTNMVIHHTGCTWVLVWKASRLYQQCCLLLNTSLKLKQRVCFVKTFEVCKELDRRYEPMNSGSGHCFR